MNLRTLSCLILAVCALVTPGMAQDPATLAAQWLGRPADSLTSIDVTSKRFPALGLEATMIKAVDPVTGQTLTECRLMDGTKADFAALVAAEKKAVRLNPDAKIQPFLRAAMGTAAASEQLSVAIWLVLDTSPVDRLQATLFDGLDLSREEYERREAEVGDFVMALAQETNAPFARFLETSGFQARYVSTTAPVMFTFATPAQIRALAALPAVDALYLEQTDYEESNIDANETHRTDRVHHYGVKGRGVDVAMLEDNGVDPACPHLVITDWFNAANPDPDDHIHGTSGNVASQLASRLGAAPDVRLYSANADTYSDMNVMAAADWIAARGVIDITNMSYGGQRNGVQSLMDRYYDYQVRQFQDSYIASAGNSGLGADVGSPAQATNVTAIGSFNERGNAFWDDDVMSTFSSTGNPNSGCVKPNLAANGDSVDTIGMAPDWLRDNYSGTSFSAPHASGNLALALSVDVTLSGPQAAMAAMMATAWHNIEGATRLSDQDGAGGLHGLALYRLGEEGRAVTVSLTANSFSTNGYYTRNITLRGGERTRVCIAWSNNADSAFNSSVLDADLDLAVFPGSNQTSGSSQGFSSSFNNNFEIIEFTPPTSGTYTVRINDFRFNGTSERVGIAWSQKAKDTSYARIREDGNDEGSTFTGPTLGSNSYDLDLLSRSPNAPAIVAPSGSSFSGYSISSISWLPVDLDIWTQIFLAGEPSWQNFIGTTNSSGNFTSPQLRIAPIPQLEGLPLQHIGVTGDASASDGIGEISEVFRFWFWPERTEFTLADDGFRRQALPFTFDFFGTSYSEVFINSNGNLTFGSGDADFSESQAEMLSDQPRIAVMWDDFNPASTSNTFTRLGVRVVDAGERHLVVEYSDVGEFASGGTSTGFNTFRVTLWADGRIVMEYNDMTVNDGIVGISPGNGTSANDPIDITSSGQLFRTGASYEVFDANNGFDLDGVRYWNKVTFTPNSLGSGYRITMDVE